MQGRDILSRVFWGSRTVLTVAPVAVVVAYAIGSLLGLLAGYYRGWVDTLINRVSDVILSFPAIVVRKPFRVIRLVIAGSPVSPSMALGLAAVVRW